MASENVDRKHCGLCEKEVTVGGERIIDPWTGEEWHMCRECRDEPFRGYTYTS